MRAHLPAEPSTLFACAAAQPDVAFLDGRGGGTRAPLSHLAWDAASRLRVGADGTASIDGIGVGKTPLEALDEFLERESTAGRCVIGAIGYGLGRWIEPRMRGKARDDLPVIALSSYRQCHTFDHSYGSWRAPPPPMRPARLGSVRVSRPRPNLQDTEYKKLFARAQEWIAAGDAYQVNLSIAFEARIDGNPAAIYGRLAKDSPVPFGAYVDFGDFQLLSNSPELFLERRGSRIATRPIKGTRPRGRSVAEDERLAEELRCDPKERAEHLMIVDLERNDLGRIAETGSVTVEDFQTVERYATLQHLESTVSARVRPGSRFSSFLRALFPGGSITGAPKIRAMQILDDLEPQGRGFYTGGILHHPPDGNFTMSIAIRTAMVRAGRIRYSAGGGVVADSRPDAELGECVLKAQAFFQAIAAEGSR